MASLDEFTRQIISKIRNANQTLNHNVKKVRILIFAEYGLIWFSHQLLESIDDLPLSEISGFIEEGMAHEDSLYHLKVIITDSIVFLDKLVQAVSGVGVDAQEKIALLLTLDEGLEPYPWLSERVLIGGYP